MGADVQSSMVIEQLRKAALAQPFQPFTIVMANGDRYRISHPEVILVAPKAERTFVISDDEVNYTILDLFLVSSLEFGSGKRMDGRRKAG
jgi:hypothetical protein